MKTDSRRIIRKIVKTLPDYASLEDGKPSSWVRIGKKVIHGSKVLIRFVCLNDDIVSDVILNEDGTMLSISVFSIYDERSKFLSLLMNKAKKEATWDSLIS